MKIFFKIYEKICTKNLYKFILDNFSLSEITEFMKSKHTYIIIINIDVEQLNVM
jgi:hypothetical protein